MPDEPANPQSHSPAVRAAWFEAYQRGEMHVYGVVIPALVAARGLRRREGVKFDTAAEFDEFLEAFTARNRDKLKEIVDRKKGEQAAATLAASSQGLSDSLTAAGATSVADATTYGFAAETGAAVAAAQDLPQPQAEPYGMADSQAAPDGTYGMAGQDALSGTRTSLFGPGGAVSTAADGTGLPRATPAPQEEESASDECCPETNRILELILEAVRELRDRSKTKDAAGQTPPQEGKKDSIMSVLEDTAFGGFPATNIGRFAQVSRFIYKGAKSRLTRLGNIFRGTAAAKGAQKAAAGAGARGATAAAVGGGEAAGAGAASAGVTAEMGAAAGGAAAAAGAAATGVGIGVAAAAVFYAAVYEFGKAVYSFARAQENEVRRLAEVGGEQAAAVAVLDANRITRDIETAGETGTSSQGLIDSIDSFEDALRPFESLLTNLQNILGSKLLDVFTAILEHLEPIAEALSDVLDALGYAKPKNRPEDLFDYVNRIAEEERRKGAPQWPAHRGQGPGLR